MIFKSLNHYPAEVAWFMRALTSHSVDGTLWRTVDQSPVWDIYMVKILNKKELPAIDVMDC